MTCEATREALLVADLDELAAEGSSEVAVHLRGCAACRHDAERILALTVGLGGTVRRRQRRRIAAAILPLAAAAGVLLIWWPRPPTGGDRTGTPPETGVPVVASAAQAPPSVRPREIAVRPRPLAGGRAYVSTPFTPTPAFQPVALAPSPMTPAATPSDEGAHKQPRIMMTSDPSITVLWFE